VIEAYDAFLKGWSHYLQSTPKGLVTAAEHFKEAIALDANYGRAHAALALTYWQASQRFWGIHFGFNWKWTRIQMMRHLEKALKSPSIIAHRLASSVYVAQRRYAESIAAAQSAIELAPSSAEAYHTLGYVLIMNGQPAEAREMVEKAWRLDPFAAGQHFFLLGLIAFAEGNLEQAAGLIERARKHIKRAQSFLPPLIAAYMNLSRTDEGRALSDNYSEWFPAYTTDLRHIMYFWPFRDKAVAARLADGLLLAGIQGKPGGYFNISDEHRLTGPEIADLFKKFGRKWKVNDVREFGETPMKLTDTFQENGTVVRNYEGAGAAGAAGAGYTNNFEWFGQYRIDGDLLCADFLLVVVGGEGCRPVYRNPDASPVGNYVIVGALGFYEFSPAD
jgi:tetratricopeptide (TPR) repeat protein